MSATISDCGKYRYSLSRRIEGVGGDRKCLFIMLNPSTADEHNDDPTVRRCIAFSKRFNCSELIIENIFAYRATNPKELNSLSDPYGPHNGKAWLESFNKVKHHGGVVICAWGANPLVTSENTPDRYCGIDLYCLGKNKNGSPKHPLYLKSNAELEIYIKAVK